MDPTQETLLQMQCEVFYVTLEMIMHIMNKPDITSGCRHVQTRTYVYNHIECIISVKINIFYTNITYRTKSALSNDIQLDVNYISSYEKLIENFSKILDSCGEVAKNVVLTNDFIETVNDIDL
jgi:hypothetical protein